MTIVQTPAQLKGHELAPEGSFTSVQLSNFKKYENVRASGRFNMFDPRAQTSAGLTKDEFLFVMKNYASLRDAI